MRHRGTRGFSAAKTADDKTRSKSQPLPQARLTNRETRNNRRFLNRRFQARVSTPLIEPLRSLTIERKGESRVIILVVSLTLLGAPEADRGAIERIEFFEKNVRPVLAARCYRCHSDASEKLRGGLALDRSEGWIRGGSRGVAIVPGEPESSLLIRAVRYGDKDLKMPPDGKLTDREIDRLVEWVKLGAPAPRSAESLQEGTTDIASGRSFWAFQPPERPKVPQVRDTSWPRTHLDHFVLARLEPHGLKPATDADRTTLIRRLYFDLLGLPPPPEAIAAFVADPSPLATDELIDRLLASRHFGERWGRHWLDVARFAESTGRSVNFPYNYAWRYRNYVIDALNADKPYDRFIREQVAGDLLMAASQREANENIIATGFLAIGPRELNYDDRELANTERYFLHSVDEQIDVTMRGILGLTVSCAQCHDHKFDPIPTVDYYALAGIFRSSETLVGYVHGLGNSGRYFPERLALLKDLPGADYDTVGAYRREATAAWRALKKEMTDLWLVRRQEGQVGFTNELREKQEKVVRDHRAKLDALAKELPPNLPVALGVVDGEEPADMRVYIAGDPENLGPLAPRGFLRVLGSAGTTTPIPANQSGRAQLADWLASRENPLTARVMVNRIWHHLFGRGIVRTVDNFGATGERPSHPRLLDHLAHRFMDQDWSVKSVIREIVRSRVYQLASDHDAENYAIDPDNRFLWRRSRRALEVEALRDALLSASGQLDPSRPNGSPLMRSGAAQIRSTKNLPPEATTIHHRHRTVYQTLIRDMEPDMLRLFDFPSTSSVHGRRNATIVAAQALFFLNDPFVTKQSHHAALRVLGRQDLSRRQRIDLAYRLILGRAASVDEKRKAERFLDARVASTSVATAGAGEGPDQENERIEAWSRFVQLLFASAEFRYIE